MNEARVTRLRRLLAGAQAPDHHTVRRHSGPLGTIRRRHLIQRAKLLASQYTLQEHLDAFVYAVGHSALTGLGLDHLEQLVARLERMGAAIDQACDPDWAPPAR